MTTRRHNANPFARVLGAATLTPSRPVVVASTPPQPSTDASGSTTSPSSRPVSTDAAPVLTAASQRWRNYAPPAVSVPETAPTIKETPEPAAPVVATAPVRPFVSTRRLALRASLVATTQEAKEPAATLPTTTTTTATGRDSATVTTASYTPAPSVAVPSAEPARTPSPTPHLPLAIPVALSARTETVTPPPCLQHAAPLCDPMPSDTPAAPLARTPAIMTNPVPGGTESATALAAALAEVARQRALVARLVAIVAADCPACCAKVVGVLVDAPVSQGIPSAVVPAVPAAPLSTGLPQQHNHFHLSIGTRRESTHANRLRQKAMGVARKSLSSTGRRKRPSTL
nr:hypothetical protein [Pandoravirus aubagnensis]